MQQLAHTIKSLLKFNLHRCAFVITFILAQLFETFFTCCFSKKRMFINIHSDLLHSERERERGRVHAKYVTRKLDHRIQKKRDKKQAHIHINNCRVIN